MPGPSTARVTSSAPLTDHSTTRSTPAIGLTLVPCGHWGFCLIRKYEITGPLGAGELPEPLPVFWPVSVVPVPVPGCRCRCRCRRRAGRCSARRR